MNIPDEFDFPGIRPRVVFGFGTVARTGAEIERLGHHRALVLSTPQQEKEARKLSDELGPASAGVYAGATMHTPTDVTEAALKVFHEIGADCLVSLGGGSTTGLGKAIASRTGADQVVIPTTYAGSEMTDILGETADGGKVTRRDPSILPETVIYDVDLTLTLPRAMTVTSALNSIAHAAEALYARDRNPVISLLSAEAIRAFADALPRLANDPGDRESRKQAAYAAWLSGIALGGVAMSLHHKICHTLGGAFNTPHAETHAIMLPHTIGFNAAAVPELLAPVADILHASPGAGLFAFCEKLGAPTRLKDLGLSEADLDRAATLAVEVPYDNPRPFERQSIRELLQDAFEGRAPRG
ncbi:MAG: maleylacetate reductase [Pseudomonadota bacterium]|nr:maleylacetate reductase [Pseudomonadota bacterium]